MQRRGRNSGLRVALSSRHRPGRASAKFVSAGFPSNTGRLVIGTITDISDRKNAEQSLLQSLAHERELGEMKSGFVSMVSHEFRTPLGVILSSTEILLNYFDRLAGDKRNDHLRTIVRSVRSLSRLVEEVLLLGKVEAGRLKFLPTASTSPPLCDQLVDEARSAAETASDRARSRP